MRATIITDASFCPETRAAGWAAWIRCDGIDPIKKSGMFKKNPATSDIAELWAILNGFFLANSIGAKYMLIQSDCKSALNIIEEWRNGIRRRDHRRLYKYIPEYVMDISIKTRWVKGHTGHKEPRYFVNRWCDEHAKIYMRQQRKIIRSAMAAE